jgi:hypothetical protein
MRNLGIVVLGAALAGCASSTGILRLVQTLIQCRKGLRRYGAVVRRRSATLSLRPTNFARSKVGSLYPITSVNLET